jgi:hypothetical protein
MYLQGLKCNMRYFRGRTRILSRRKRKKKKRSESKISHRNRAIASRQKVAARENSFPDCTSTTLRLRSNRYTHNRQHQSGPIQFHLSQMSSPIDSAPLLSPSGRFPSRRLQSLTLHGAVRFLQRNTTNRRNMSEPSMLVREAAAEQLDERQGDWAYSKPVCLVHFFYSYSC